ncbi:MAG: DUF6079 family protein [Pyrinomonadaceae bacterium]
MKRIQEKVKDLIDVRPHQVVQDFLSDPAQTLAIYHFTDITADLMAQWIDRVVDVSFGNGRSNALAGYRGVGKSHFLATLGAIIAHPELRSRVTDPHVSASAQRLKRRRYPVAYVRRGIFDDFIDELRAAIAKSLGLDVTPIDSLEGLLSIAAEQSQDLPFVLIIDTAFERTSRVSRDDGAILSQIAEIAKHLNMFVAVALDDDISGADGANAAITQTYMIDFLDQEHLYRIVNNYIFPKHRQTLPLLHDIYNDFRSTLPSFRWSEQRFVSLYPLHPMILEIAPFVRLYAQDFALLSFSADAGRKIMGRPANSLIALDEVFDSVENTLRKVTDLNEAFATYDQLNTEVVSHIPVMHRMQAKLILKGLLLLSLDGYGTTVGEISAAMLIFDENDPSKSNKEVEDLLETFVAAFPENIERRVEEDRETRYSLKVSSKENLNNALSEAIKSVSGGVIPKLLRRVARDKFPEWLLPNETEGQKADLVDCQVIWRGGIRRGRINWALEQSQPGESPVAPANSDLYDWEVVVTPSHLPIAEVAGGEVPKAFWQPAPLKKDEAETILRYFVLLTNAKLREEYGEQWQVAGHAHTVSVEKIWMRIFFQDAKFIIDGAEYPITEEARTAMSLSEMLSKMIEPLFEVRYPNHPFFAEPLGMTEVSALVNDFFSGARQTSSEVQRLSQTFALPLGLVALRGEAHVLETEENIVNLPLAQEVLSLVNNLPEGQDTVSLKQINHQLKQSPFGLMRESQHLILTSLVAQRQVEFVTSKGDRINRRSLDLKIIWDDIVGIAKPTGHTYGSKRLTTWAQLLTGAEDFQTIDLPSDQVAIRAAFERWMGDWESAAVLRRFNELPDEILNTKIWRCSMNSQKTFGAVAATVAEVLDNSISLEEGLYRIADAFSDSEEVFFACTKDLVVLEDFINSADQRREIWDYLAVCDTTEDKRIEALRDRLLRVIDEIYFEPSADLAGEMHELWKNFLEQFTEHFASQHDAVMKSHLLQEKFDEIRHGDEWWEFENLSALPIFPPAHWKEATRVCRQFNELNCRFDVRQMLQTHPFCACSFNLTQISEWDKLPEILEEKVTEGRSSYRRILNSESARLIPLIEKFGQRDREGDFADSVKHLVDVLRSGQEIPLLTTEELIILQKIFEPLSEPAPQKTGFAESEEILETADLLSELN